MSEKLMRFDGEPLHKGSLRKIQVDGTDAGTLLIGVETFWGGTGHDRSMVALTVEELRSIASYVLDGRKNEVTRMEDNPAMRSALAEARELLDA